jgi:phosphoglycerate kinase
VSEALPGIDTLGDLAGKRVLVRCDLNVPLDGSRITDDGRIRASVPTLERLLAGGARVIVLAHLGRPKGEPDPRYSLAPVATRLGELLGRDVPLSTDLASLPDADVVLLENVRFEPAETAKDPAARAELAARWAALGDAYVDDAFGAVHRAHASVHELAQLLPHAAGDLVLREVEVLERLTHDPERPYVVVLGGSKVSGKLAVIEHLLPTVDRLLVGGGMSYTFLAALGYSVGNSLLETDQIEACKGFLATGKVTVPVDLIVAKQIKAGTETQLVDADSIPDGWEGLDMGPRTIALYAEQLADARTVFWNGPVGVFEVEDFATGTRSVGETIAGLTDALTVVGGGDVVAAVRTLGIGEHRFSHISTGGGASLEFLEGKSLPGLAVLEI